MVENSEKFLSLDEFKEKVYKNIGTLESFDEISFDKMHEKANKGCLSFFIMPFLINIGLSTKKKVHKYWKIKELNKKADEILANEEIKKLLCEKLDATIVLPIDAAYKITPVLYGLALEDEEKVPFDSMIFAIISRKIVKQGVENYCGKTSTKEEKDKGEKTTGKKRASD